MQQLPITAMLLLLVFIVAGCSKKIGIEHDTAVGIGPYSTFSGRLIVIEPKRRWQVALDWQAASPENGWLRLSHAATGTVVEFRWLQNNMEVRDNSHPEWKSINQQQLSKQGIVLPPQQLAGILLGKMPAHFKQKSDTMWESKATGSLIRIEWDAEKQRLTMTDILHGRRATLIIQSDIQS
ncbi:MAG: hypothetical protein AUJ57_02470 [Zetaproteobacteria bacterium CG1_02_53_45]|nr:MAG: hypothetical protein AUJ57_02470 [Zetaproteobacteria bacterium CG1_02_53_45]